MSYNPNDLISNTEEGDTVFGVPSCILDLGLKALALLSPEILALIVDKINKAIAAARNYIHDLIQPLFDWLGAVEYDSILGLLGIKVDLGFFGVDSVLLGAVASLAGLGAIISTLGAYYNMALDEINEIKDCLDKFKNQVEFERGPQSTDSNGDPIPLGPTAADEHLLRFKLDAAESFIEKANGLLGRISTVVEERINGTSIDPNDLSAILAGDGDEEEIFRLTYGPPESKVGTFLLSVDGLYYDSQNREYALSGDIPTVEDIGFIPNKDRWSMDHAPSLGGKGTKITIGDLNKYVDTILDIEEVDESDFLRRHYEKDHLLNSLEGYKAKNITDLERSKQNLIDEGHDTSSAIYINFQQQIFSEIEIFDLKIRKRKKQIELAVKAPDLFGVSDAFEPGKVPVNDFTYLSKIHLNVALEKQRKLVLDHGEVSGVILPMKPVFVETKNSENNVSIAPLLVSQTGVGTISEVHSPEKSEDLLPVLTLTDPIAVEGLVSIYNFLDSEVTNPDSGSFTVLNCNGDTAQNAQIVGKSSSEVFTQGLAIPKLDGIVRYEDDPGGSFIKYKGLGSYIRLPQTSEMQNLMYNRKGCSFDFWLFLSGLGRGQNDWESDNNSEFNLGNDTSSQASWTDFNYYKVILANDNTGGEVSDPSKTDIENAGNVVIDKSTSRVRGMMMGFTRDPLFTNDVTGNPTTDTGIDSATASINGTSFFIAPTQSWSSSGIGFLRSEDCTPETSTYRGLRIPITETTESGYSLSSAGNKFVHLSISFDVINNSIKVYLNSELLHTDSLSDVFGTDVGEPPKVPSFKKDNSFEYGISNIPTSQTLDFVGGPKNDSFFTPWIIGGAWSDGTFLDTATSSGGFMGTGSGLYSGLGGHLGSFKIYTNPLTEEEILKNYEAHRILFNNINIT